MDDHLRERIDCKRRNIALLRQEHPSYRETAGMVLGDDEMEKAEWLFRDELIARDEASLLRLLEFAALEEV